MRQDEFQSFSDLFKGPLVNRKLPQDHNWRKIRWLRFNKAKPGVFFYKRTLSALEDFDKVDFKRNSKIKKLLLTTKRRYNTANPITNEKKSNLLDLLPYISDTFHDFYKNLRTTNDPVDVYPDESSSDESNA